MKMRESKKQMYSRNVSNSTKLWVKITDKETQVLEVGRVQEVSDVTVFP